MRIGISTRGLNKGSYAIRTIIYHLSTQIIELSAGQHEVFLYFNDPEHEDLFNDSVQKRTCRIQNRFLWDQVWLPAAVKKDQIDIILFMKGTMPLLLPTNAAIIFHDLGYFHDELSAYRKNETIYMKIMMRQAARLSKHIFADSKFTHDEAIEFFKLNPSKINVCYLDCSPLYQPVSENSRIEEVRERYNLPEHFIFFPTSLSPRKNIPRTLEALNTVKDQILQDIVLTGGQAWRVKELIKDIHSGFYDRVHLLGHIPDEDLPVIYSMADFTLYPSLLEGFGMPILEAFRCGSPILTSNITSMPELAGDAAYLVDPYDVEQIAEGIKHLATNTDLRRSLILKGREQQKLFSWEKAAREILAVLTK
ncbi:MAG: glycosyltransferase family 4 protein [Anaerolineaceae bacterium]|nr:glycosyltransferase family 4 protein [Anaerolineaceae bacterium]